MSGAVGEKVRVEKPLKIGESESSLSGTEPVEGLRSFKRIGESLRRLDSRRDW